MGLLQGSGAATGEVRGGRYGVITWLASKWVYGIVRIRTPYHTYSVQKSLITVPNPALITPYAFREDFMVELIIGSQRRRYYWYVRIRGHAVRSVSEEIPDFHSPFCFHYSYRMVVTD